MSISLTVLLLLLAGGVTFGMAYFSYVSLRDAAQEGALFGSFNPCVTSNGTCSTTSAVNDAGIRARIRSSSTTPVNLSSAAAVPDAYINITTVGPACEASTGGIPNAMQVTVQYDYPIFMPFMGAILGNQNIHLTATVTDTILTPHCQ